MALDLVTTRALFARAIMRLKNAVDALASDPGNPHTAAAAALAALNTDA